MTKRKFLKSICACVCALTCMLAFGACDMLSSVLPSMQAGQEDREQIGVIYALAEDKQSAKVVGYNGSETAVVVADSYQGVPVTRIDNDAFALRPIISVHLPDTVTSIGFSAFYFCTRLQQITLSNNLQAIGGSAFENCDLLMQVEIPDSVKTVGRRAFANCNGLTSVTFGNSVVYIGSRVFENSRNVTMVTLKQTSGWASGNKGFTVEELSNTATAARYMRVTYFRDGWTRS